MKKLITYSLLSSLVFGLFLSVGIGCSKSKKATNNCEFIGYHLEVGDDSLYLYDGSKLVSALSWSEVGKLDSVIIADNQ